MRIPPILCFIFAALSCFGQITSNRVDSVMVNHNTRIVVAPTNFWQVQRSDPNFSAAVSNTYVRNAVYAEKSTNSSYATNALYSSYATNSGFATNSSYATNAGVAQIANTISGTLSSTNLPVYILTNNNAANVGLYGGLNMKGMIQFYSADDYVTGSPNFQWTQEKLIGFDGTDFGFSLFANGDFNTIGVLAGNGSGLTNLALTNIVGLTDYVTNAILGNVNPNSLTNLDTRSWTNNIGIYGNGLGLTNLDMAGIVGLSNYVTNAILGNVNPNSLTNLDTRYWTNDTGIYGNGLGLTNLSLNGIVGISNYITNAILSTVNPNSLTNLDTRSWTNNTGIYGNGIGLTNLNPASLSGSIQASNISGTVSEASHATWSDYAEYVTYITNRIEYATNAENAQMANNISGVISPTNMPGNVLTNLDTRSWTNNTGIYGSGVGLTNIPAESLAGPLPWRCLNAEAYGRNNVLTNKQEQNAIYGMTNVTEGSDTSWTWDNGSGEFRLWGTTSLFTGNGSGLTNLQSSSLVGTITNPIVTSGLDVLGSIRVASVTADSIVGNALGMYNLSATNVVGLLTNNTTGNATTAAGAQYATNTPYGGTLAGLSGTNVWTGTNTFSNPVLFSTGIGTTNLIVGPPDTNFAIVAGTPIQTSNTIAGRSLTIKASNATIGISAGFANGGGVNILGGNGAAVSGNGNQGGNINITAGSASQSAGSGPGGNITLTAGSGYNVTGGSITLATTASANATSGDITITTGNLGTGNSCGSVTISGGTTSGNGSFSGGDVIIQGGRQTGTGNPQSSRHVKILTYPPGDQNVGVMGSNGGNVMNLLGAGGTCSYSVSGTGGIGGNYAILTGSGGNATGTGSGTYSGGMGGNIEFSIGSGGSNTISTTAIGVGGNAGNFNISGGVGGSANSKTNATGGNGSTLTFSSGAGGNAIGASGTRTGGNSGDIIFNVGTNGTGATANGSLGTIQFNVPTATNQMTIGGSGVGITTLSAGTITATNGIEAGGQALDSTNVFQVDTLGAAKALQVGTNGNAYLSKIRGPLTSGSWGTKGATAIGPYSENTGLWFGSGTFDFCKSGIDLFRFDSGYGRLQYQMQFGWCSGEPDGTVNDAYFERDSPGTIRVNTNLVARGTITATNGIVNYGTGWAGTTNTAPTDTTTVKAWVNYTNTTGGTFKLPVYGPSVAGTVTSGRATLTSGTNLVSTSLVTTNSIIMLTYVSLNGSSASIYYKPSEITNNASFTIRSTSSTDTNQVNWNILP